jgi:enoyl-CoA hydratase
MSARIEFEQQQGVARITIHHPKRFNAMSRNMWRELKSVFESIACDTALRCVLISGRGAHFCAGGDISEYADFRFHEATLREFHEVEVWGGLQAMLACDVPIVAKIRGNCMGAGVEIASCCDIRLAAKSAKFGAPIARLGFPMAPREAALVTSELGAMTARQMLLTAAVLDAPELATRGFLTAVVADDDLAAEAQVTVQRILALAPQAARLNKQTFRVLNHALDLMDKANKAINSDSFQVVDGGFQEVPSVNAAGHGPTLAELIEQAYTYADSAEHREGIAAFLHKRPPVF